MPTTTALTTTYAGKFAGKYILSAFKSLDTLKHITVKENIAYKEVVKKLVNTVTFGAPSCDFTPGGTVTITERALTLEWFDVARVLCKNDFLTDWETDQMGGLSKLPPALQETMLLSMLGGIAQEMERVIHVGANATVGEFDGLKVLMLADSTVIDSASQTTLSSSNIVAEIGDLINTFAASAKGPAVMASQEKPKLYMNAFTWFLYQQAQMTLGNGNFFNVGADIPKRYGEYEIAVCGGMPNDTMYFMQPSNVWFGTNGVSDLNNIAVLDMFDHDLSNNVRFRAQFAGGVQYGFGDEIGLYGT